MGNYALVKDGIVVNTAVWDGEAEVNFGEGVNAVLFTSDDRVSIGYSFKNGKFVEPNPTEDELAAQQASAKASNLSQKLYRLEEASQRLSILQDAVDLEMATEKETLALPAWKKYRVLMSRIDADTASDIEWPEKPYF